MAVVNYLGFLVILKKVDVFGGLITLGFDGARLKANYCHTNHHSSKTISPFAKIGPFLETARLHSTLSTLCALVIANSVSATLFAATGGVVL